MAVIYDLTSNGHTAVLTTSIIIALATIFVSARLYSRFGLLKTCKADDWFIIAAWVFALGMSISTISGNHVVKNIEHNPRSRHLVRSFDFAFTILYNPALMATKTSALISYIRIAKNNQRLLSVASYAILALVNVSGVILTVLNTINCDFKASDNEIRSPGRGHYIVVLYMCSAPVNVFIDLSILIIPIPTLTAMRILMKQKFILVATFSMGIFVTIVGIIRVFYLQKAVTEQRILVSKSGFEVDFAWSASTVFMWSNIEVNVGIICYCIPMLKPLVMKMILSKNAKSPKAIPLASFTHRNSLDMRERISTSILRMKFPLPAPSVGTSQQGHHFMETLNTTVTPEARFSTSLMDPSLFNQNTENSSNFGFVKMVRPKSMLEAQGWESFLNCAIVTSLFFLSGLSYGLIFNLFESILISPEISLRTVSLSTAYFGAYLLGALVIGKKLLSSYGFKATFITGLIIYATGTLILWPSVALISYPGFVVSNIIIGTGISVLETGANTFLVLCGSSSKAEFRLLLAQAVQATATILIQLFAKNMVSHDTLTLIDLQWSYTTITLLPVALALGIYYATLAEASDDDLANRTRVNPIITSNPYGEIRYSFNHDTLIDTAMRIYRRAILRNIFYVIAIFFCIAAETLLLLYFQPTAVDFYPSSMYGNIFPVSYTFAALSLFAFGRFIFAMLCLLYTPRLLLFMALNLCLIFSAVIFMLPILVVTTDRTSSFSFTNLFRGLTLVNFFFEGPIFPLIFSLGLQRMGRRTKSTAANLIAAVSAGGIPPWLVLMVHSLDRPKNRRIPQGFLVAFFAGIIAILIPNSGWWRIKDQNYIENLERG